MGFGEKAEKSTEEHSIFHFSETLSELMFERGNMTAKALAGQLHIAAPTLTRYLHAQRTPTVENLVRIADYFACSTDFLPGLEQYNPSLRFHVCPPFSERLAFLMQHFETTCEKLCREANIADSAFFAWKNGSKQPTIDSILKLADHFDCRVDFILGRES